MGKKLLDASRGHSNFTITEEGEWIVFGKNSCFDYNTGEWDVFSATISKSDFIKGAKEFLQTGACKVGKLEIATKSGKIYISLGKCYDVFSSLWDDLDWFFVDKFDTNQFLEMLKRVTE